MESGAHIWIREFLTNRSQRVIIDNEFSMPSPVVSGVPQGTVLGLLLILLLPSTINSTIKLMMFRVLATDQQILQKDIDTLAQ